MTHIITIETQSATHFAQIKGLAERLGARIKDAHTEAELSEAEALELLNRVAGSWQGDIDIGPHRVPVDQKELSKKVLALRTRFQHVQVDPNLDLSALANEMLGE